MKEKEIPYALFGVIQVGDSYALNKRERAHLRIYRDRERTW